MMLSRTGWDRPPLSVAARPVGAGGHHGDVPRVRPDRGAPLLLLLLLLAVTVVDPASQDGHRIS